MSQKSKELPDNTKRIVARSRPIAGQPVRTQAQIEPDRLATQPRRAAAVTPSVARSTLPVRAAGGVATRPYERLMPLAGGFGGVALAAVGEMLVEGGDRTFLSLLLYLAGIALFAVSAWRVPSTPHDPSAGSGQALSQTADATVSPSVTERRRAWMILG